jgi:predicted cupin superfamily sugar epimerase
MNNPAMQTAAYYINKQKLTRHKEGGSYAETYRSPLVLPNDVIGNAFKGSCNACTAIYFLLEHNQFSAFHRIASDETSMIRLSQTRMKIHHASSIRPIKNKLFTDEIWHFYAGNVLSIYDIDERGELTVHKLGNNLESGETFQCVIKAGHWFASRCEVENGFSLVGCTVSPGFDFNDFELADRKTLCELYPAHAAIIETLTY